MESKKIESEELDRLRSLHNNHNASKDLIAHIEVKLNRLKTQKTTALVNFDNTESMLDSYEDEMVEKYGKRISIDLKDGSITKTSD